MSAADNTELYEPASVGRTLGYNGFLIAIIGDALSPPLMLFAQEPTIEVDEGPRFFQIKVFLLCLVLPSSLALVVCVKRLTSKDPGMCT